MSNHGGEKRFGLARACARLEIIEEFRPGLRTQKIDWFGIARGYSCRNRGANGHREDEKQAGFGRSTSWRNYTPALVQSRSMALAGKMARPMVNHQGVYL